MGWPGPGEALVEACAFSRDLNARMWGPPSGRVVLLAVLLASGVTQVAAQDSRTSWRHAVAEANEVSRLSDRIQQTEAMIEDWQRKHEKAREFHESQKKLIEKSIEIRKQQGQLQNEELENYEKELEERYTYQMCSLILEGFFFGKDKEKRLHILHLCHGRKSLALADAGAPRRSHHRHRRLLRRGGGSGGVRSWDEAMLQGLGQELRTIAGEVHALVAVARRLEHQGYRGPVESMRSRLRVLQNELKAIRKQYHEDSARWRQERNELKAEEAALGGGVNANWDEKQAMKKRAWTKVKNKYCPVINENYGLSEEKITDYAIATCGGE